MASQFRTTKNWTTRRWGVPDYSNQLDLFSEAVPDASETEEPIASRRVPSSQTRPRRLEQMRLDMCEPLQPDDPVHAPRATHDIPTRADQKHEVQEVRAQTAMAVRVFGDKGSSSAAIETH